MPHQDHQTTVGSTNTSTAFSAEEHEWMRLALSIAKKGEYSTTPNPAVGCVIVDVNGQLIGQGYHQQAGQPHAEVFALQQAGKLAEGATAYVTLEPCSHQGRTPACAAALIKARVSRVIIATTDSNPLVNNAGIDMLEAAGVIVSVGLLAEQAALLNRAFLYRMQTTLPWICVKLAASVDGKTALHNGISKWITSDLARADVQDFRARHCAILTGADTILADNPHLNVRPATLSDDARSCFLNRAKQPLRVVIDSKNRLSDSFNIFQDGQPVLVLNAAHNKNLTSTAVRQHQLPLNATSTYLDLPSAMLYLGTLALNSIWVEAGARLTGALFDQGCVNQLILYQAPKILGFNAKSLINSKQIDVLSDAIDLKLNEMVQIGDDLRLSYEITNKDK